MIKEEARRIANEIMQDVHLLGIDLPINDKLEVGKLIALKLKEKTNDAVYQYVINELNDRKKA